jgi:hypothetical protein
MNSTTRYDTSDLSGKLAVTTEDLQNILSCGRKSAVDIGEKAEAKIQLGRRVLWNVEKIKIYLNLISS